MDLNALNHEYHKIMVDSNIRNTDGNISSPPPAYTQHQPPFESGSEGILEDEDDDEDYEDLYSDPEQTRPTARCRSRSRSRSHTPESVLEDGNAGEKSIHINNKLTVLGSQNILTTAPLDGMRWTASILAILNGNRPLPCQEQQPQQRAAAVQEGQPPNAQSVFVQRGGPVNILIDCSSHVVGSRNIIGGNPAAAVYGAVVAGRGNAAAQAQNGAVHAATAPNTANSSNDTSVAPPAMPSAPLGGRDTTAAPHSHPHRPLSYHAHPSVSLPRASPAQPPRHQRQNHPAPANDCKKRKHACDSLCSLTLPPLMPVGGSSGSSSNPGFGPGSPTSPHNFPHLPAPAPSPPPAPTHPSIVAAIATELADAGVCEDAPAGADVANGDADGPRVRARKRARRGESGDHAVDSDDGEGEGEVAENKDEGGL